MKNLSFKALFPTRALLLLLAIGWIDLVTTALLHHHGMIVELNPLMKPLIETSEWLFALVKAMTLVLAWLTMVRFYETHADFIRKACLAGSGAYMFIWTIWFIRGS